MSHRQARRRPVDKAATLAKTVAMAQFVVVVAGLGALFAGIMLAAESGLPLIGVAVAGGGVAVALVALAVLGYIEWQLNRQSN